jgi:hypothetical protein
MELDYEALREKHKDVLENKAVQAIANWYRNPPQLGEPIKEISEEQYMENARRNMKGLSKKMIEAVKNI